MKQYACLECGLVHDGRIIKRERIDKERASFKYISSPPFHGYITCRICPECGDKKQMKVEEDK